MTIEIRDLAFECIIGILDFERAVPQCVLIDAVIDYTYDGEHFLDYAAVAAMFKSEMTARQFELIEEALEALTGTFKTQFPAAKRLELTISKPDILPDCRVSVTLKSNF